MSWRLWIGAVEGTDVTTDEVDLVDEIFGLAPGGSAAQPTSAAQPASAAQPSWAESGRSESASPAVSPVFAEPKPQSQLLTPHPRAGSRRRRALLAAKLAIAFVVGAIVSLVVVAAVALVALSSFSNRVVPGVRVGSVDVSGMDRAQVVASLQTAYAYLGQG